MRSHYYKSTVMVVNSRDGWACANGVTRTALRIIVLLVLIGVLTGKCCSGHIVNITTCKLCSKQIGILLV